MLKINTSLLVTSCYMSLMASCFAIPTPDFLNDKVTVGTDLGINRNDGEDKFIFGFHARMDYNKFVGFELGYTNFPDNEPAPGYNNWWTLTSLVDVHAPFWFDTSAFIQVGVGLSNMDNPSGDYYSYIRPVVSGGLRYPINDHIQATIKAQYFEYAESLGVGAHTYTLTGGLDYRF